ncbi:hypothetical protein VE02_05646 [Pseudogymnoascus sp. 03VT05]|nr:hypothetical protein VE02_05646 [Pseudogymnoascus sp. 03VT05]
MRLTLASIGLFAVANAAAVATPVVTSNHEARNRDPWQQYKAYCDLSELGPGWSGFLKVHYAFTKIWASTPAGFCVDRSNWACVTCDDVYMFFEPQLVPPYQHAIPETNLVQFLLYSTELLTRARGTAGWVLTTGFGNLVMYIRTIK